MRKTVSLLAAALIAAASFGLGLAGALFLSGRLPGGGGAGPEPPSQGAKPAIERPDGIWHRARPELRASAEDMETMKELANLPYLDGYEPAPDLRDVTVHDPARAFDGLNLVVSAHAAQAALVDMDGRVLHTWQRPIEDVWPDLDFEGREGFGTFWRRACALPNGDLLAIYDRIGMIRLDRDSELIWANPGGYHHDLEVVPDGTIYTLARAEREEHDRLKLTGPIEEDFVAILAPEDGRELRRVSILDCFLNSDYQSVLAGARSEGDLMHVNTVERMDGRFAERHPLFAEGLVLISTPTLNTIATVDLERETVVWALGGMWRFQHQPTVVGDGHLLVFDNLGQDGSSKVIELDPRTQEVVWAYRGSPGRRFWSNFLGSCQRLPNGNTLVTESTAGRAFEVTPGGEIVWEYVNPHRAGEDESLIASLLEVVRMGRDDFSADFAVAHED